MLRPLARMIMKDRSASSPCQGTIDVRASEKCPQALLHWRPEIIGTAMPNLLYSSVTKESADQCPTLAKLKMRHRASHFRYCKLSQLAATQRLPCRVLHR